jgi:CubicO group peptidase (beta-lactamase class C family)
VGGFSKSRLNHSVGTYGWTGGLGTSWASDPPENLTLILLTQHAFTSHLGPALLVHPPAAARMTTGTPR